MTRPLPAAPGNRQRPLIGRLLAVFPRFLASIPVTLLTLGMLLAAGVLTGTLFASADPDDAAITSLEFGLPAFRDGRIWTLFTGAVTFTEPEFYYLVGALLAVGLGLYERRVGSLRAAFALLVTHSAGIVLPAMLLWPFAGSTWTWAATLSGELDAGLSAGGFGVAAAASALLNPPWRGRLRVLGTTLLAVMVIKSGLLWDLEHFSAWLVGLAIGPWLAAPVRAARAARTDPADPVAPVADGAVAAVPAGLAARTPTPAEARVLTALIVAGFAISNVVEALYPGLGGIVGPGVGSAEVRGVWLIVLELVISLLIAGALPRPLALAWWVAVVGAMAVAANSMLNTRGQPRVGDAVCAVIVLALLLWNRHSWPWRNDRAGLRPLGVLLASMAVFTAVACVAIWAARVDFRPTPNFWQILREALSRFTFTGGPLVTAGSTARTVISLIEAIWAVTLIGWLVSALYVAPAARLGLPWRRIGRGDPKRQGQVDMA